MNKLEALVAQATRLHITADRAYLEAGDTHSAAFLAKHARRAGRAVRHTVIERQRRAARNASRA